MRQVVRNFSWLIHNLFLLTTNFSKWSSTVSLSDLFGPKEVSSGIILVFFGWKYRLYSCIISSISFVSGSVWYSDLAQRMSCCILTSSVSHSASLAALFSIIILMSMSSFLSVYCLNLSSNCQLLQFFSDYFFVKARYLYFYSVIFLCIFSVELIIPNFLAWNIVVNHVLFYGFKKAPQYMFSFQSDSRKNLFCYDHGCWFNDQTRTKVYPFLSV